LWFVAERLDRDVLLLKPTLIIWETGATEAVRGTDIEEFRETMQAGIDKLRASG
jgi:acyl-CoA thioesterase I